MSTNKHIPFVRMALVIMLIFLVTTIASFGLVKTGERNKTFRLTTSQAKQVTHDTRSFTELEIIDYSLRLTASSLSFCTRNNISNGKANCVGYAQFCSSVCNTALTANKIKAKAVPVVGYITTDNINLCKLAESVMPKQSYKNFVKDHDFVELRTRTSVYQFDPCLYDVIGVSCLSKKPLH